ncbi:MAG TPA: CvpA family protein [Caldisericia bacterium]|nr:CvpA family protein [Caldisericia bacterium]HPF49246.1 CvpA family protein [Caldisericia bacterium]HPI84074.1 CvpA family protein [Caldisericia bacterium]HPQ93332.1 CvpA family protein [Caldisericia bacterium]HRV75286.1 CvpA family protein [Caldisericia bacterium]
MNWIDVVILAVIVVAGVRGFMQGLSGVLLNAIATCIGWLAALLLAAPVKNLLEGAFGWVSSLASYMAPAIPGTPIAGGTDPVTALTQSGLPEWSKNVLSRVADSNYVVSSTSDLVAYWIANILIVIVVFIVLLIVLGFIARYLMRSVQLALPKEGFFHDFDRLVGGIVYFVLALFVMLGILVMFAALFPSDAAVTSPVGSYVMSSFFGGLVYSNFLGVQTIYGSLLRLVIGY